PHLTRRVGGLGLGRRTRRARARAPVGLRRRRTAADAAAHVAGGQGAALARRRHLVVVRRAPRGAPRRRAAVRCHGARARPALAPSGLVGSSARRRPPSAAHHQPRAWPSTASSRPPRPHHHDSMPRRPGTAKGAETPPRSPVAVRRTPRGCYAPPPMLDRLRRWLTPASQRPLIAMIEGWLGDGGSDVLVIEHRFSRCELRREANEIVVWLPAATLLLRHASSPATAPEAPYD